MAERAPIDVLIAELGDEHILGLGVTNHFRIILDHGEQVIVEL